MNSAGGRDRSSAGEAKGLVTVLGADCPLKRGHPYFCPNGGSSHDQLCVFHGNEDEAKRSGMALEQECILDIFERTAGLRGQ